MRVRFDRNEWWPVYSIERVDREKEWMFVVDLPDEKVKEIERIQAEFEALQRELHQLWGKNDAETT